MLCKLISLSLSIKVKKSNIYIYCRWSLIALIWAANRTWIFVQFDHVMSVIGGNRHHWFKFANFLSITLCGTLNMYICVLKKYLCNYCILIYYTSTNWPCDWSIILLSNMHGLLFYWWFKYRKIQKKSPRACIFQRPFLRGLSLEENLHFKIDWASFIVGRILTIFPLFNFVFEDNFRNTSRRRGL